jgi:hypothetical protein
VNVLDEESGRKMVAKTKSGTPDVLEVPDPLVGRGGLEPPTR